MISKEPTKGRYGLAIERYQSRNPIRHLFAKFFQREDLIKVWATASKSVDISPELSRISQGVGLIFLRTTSEVPLKPEHIQNIKRIEITAATELDRSPSGPYTE